MFGFQSYSKGHQRPWWGFQPIRGFSTHIVCHMSTSFCVVVVLAVHMNHWRYSHHCAGLCFAGLCVCVLERGIFKEHDSQTTSNTFPLLQRLDAKKQEVFWQSGNWEHFQNISYSIWLRQLRERKAKRGARGAGVVSRRTEPEKRVSVPACKAGLSCIEVGAQHHILVG